MSIVRLMRLSHLLWIWIILQASCCQNHPFATLGLRTDRPACPLCELGLTIAWAISAKILIFLLWSKASFSAKFYGHRRIAIGQLKILSKLRRLKTILGCSLQPLLFFPSFGLYVWLFSLWIWGLALEAY